MPYIDGEPVATSLAPTDLVIVCQGSTGVPGSGTTRSATVSQLTGTYPVSAAMAPVVNAPTIGDAETLLGITANTTNIATNTANIATNTTAIATETARATAAEALLAPRASPTFTGVPAAPTAAPGANTTQLATTAFVTNAVVAGVAGVASVNTRTGAVTLALSDIPGAAPLASPTFTGVPLAPTASPGTATTQIATTAFTDTSFQKKLTAGQLPGTNTNDDASAGNVGQYISSSVAVGGSVSLLNATTANITSITLTPGDWDVWGNVVTNPGISTTTSYAVGAISTASATAPTPPNGGAYAVTGPGSTGSQMAFAVGMRRLSVSTNTTVYLVTNIFFSISTMSAYGFLGARRVR